jgi:uncharacterized protein YbjT (DUF2867 family)
MAAPILVTGGTGTLGKCVVPRLWATGAKVRVLSRSTHEPTDGIEFASGNLSTGRGIAEALQGVETVVHLAGSAKGDEEKARVLVREASKVGVRHLVYISVVGADRIPVTGAFDRGMFSYYAAKRAAELVVAESGLPWTTLRATQFHDLILTVAKFASKLPVVPVPTGFRFQPVDTDEVAERLVQLALDQPAGLVPDLGGPRVYDVKDLIRRYLRAAGKHRATMPIWFPGDAAKALRRGANLTPEHAEGRRTFEEFLAERFGD